MFDIVKKLMFAREIDFEEGSINLLGHPIVMCPVVTFVEIRKMLETVDATALLYQASKTSGIDYMKSIGKKFGMKEQDLLKWGVNTISLAGWGKTKILKLDPEEKISITVLEDSSFVRCYGKSREPVDDIFRGYAAATASICFKTDMDVIEVKCKAMGDRVCEIVAKPFGSFDMKDPSVRKQLEIQNKSIAKMLENKQAISSSKERQ